MSSRLDIIQSKHGHAFILCTRACRLNFSTDTKENKTSIMEVHKKTI